GVGGEKGVAGPGGEDHHTPLLQVADGAAADVVLANLVDADGGHHPRVEAEALQRVLHRDRIHDRGQHAHVVGGHTIHPGARETRAAEDVAAADHYRHLHAETDDLLQLPGDTLEHRRVDPVVGGAHEGLSRELHENAGVASLGRAFCHTPKALS